MANNILTLKRLFQITPEKAARCKDKTFVGIDFGTSTTVVSIASLSEDGETIKSETIQLGQKLPSGAKVESDLLNSVIAISPNGGLLVGQGAYQLKGRPEFKFGENIWHSFKMELGTNLGPRWFKSKQSRIKSPQEATSVFFRYLKSRIIEYCEQNGLSTNIQYAVSIPASFESNQRQDLIKALEENDIVISGHNLIDEPNAAFLGYINPNNDYKKEIAFASDYNPKVLVFDFGAGTCDISILEINADYQGLHTRNISISQFTELGGNDIDRYIAYHYLLPTILKLNGLSKDDFIDKQIDIIVNQLMGIAEKLKIEASKAFEFLLDEKSMMDKMVRDGSDVTVTIPTTIYTDYKDLVQEKFSLKLSEFLETMNVFFSKKQFSISSLFKKNKGKNCIENTIESAVNKAHVNKSEIDYVMLIGGSSKNRFVQESLKKYFGKHTEVLVAQNLQTLVSQGAAIHSLLVNGLEITAVRPITSEPIVAVLRGEETLPIIVAGTEIPFPAIKLDRFTTGDNLQKVIEIPICVSNARKVLTNVRIENPSGEPFPKNQTIELVIEMSADKVLSVKATCAGIKCVTTTENPFANTYLTDDEKKILIAQRETYISADRNNGRPTKESLRKLYQAYLDADNEYMAAETLAEQLTYYPDDSLCNAIGVGYANSGNPNKAIIYHRKAIEYNPNSSVNYSNLGHQLMQIGELDEAEAAFLKALELRADNTTALDCLGDLKELDGETEAAMEYFRKEYNIFKLRRQKGALSKVDYTWFIPVARKLGETEMVETLLKEQPRKAQSSLYNLENLVSISKGQKHNE